MFHISEANKNKGILTVKNGKMSLHISLAAKGILALYLGTKEQAKNDKEHCLNPTNDTVIFEDGTEEEVFGFDIPINAINEEFNVAIVGKKGKWNDHKAIVSDVQFVKLNNDILQKSEAPKIESNAQTLSYEVKVEGGSGRAKIVSPCKIKIENNQPFIELCWNSKYYDYMIVNDKKYISKIENKQSCFSIPLKQLKDSFSLDVIANTTMMSTPHEIEYKLTFNVIK